MRVCVATFGSDGDVQPFLALSGALAKAGHSVELATVDRYESRARARGIPFRRVGRPWIDEDDDTRARMRTIVSTRDPAKQAGLIIRMLEPDLVAMVPDLLAAVSEADLVVSHSFDVPAIAAARARGKPVVVVHLFPSTLRSAKMSPLGPSYGRVVNAALWSIAERLTRKHTDGGFASSIEAAGLPRWRDVMFREGHSDLLNLVAISPVLVPADPAWGSRYVVSGYLFAPPLDAHPSAELVQFLGGGETSADDRPIVVTFGSMVFDDPAKTTAILVDALAGLGRKVVLQSGWAGLGDGELPANVWRAPFVRHDWLFERAGLVVHHGGAGTTAAALRAGVPQIIVPHLGDQFLWAALARRSGASAATLPRRTLTARGLERAARKALASRSAQQRAAELGQQVRREDGVAAAVAAIERCLP